MKKLLEHMGPVFKQWADQYFESEIAIQFEDFQKKNPEESAKCDIESFKEKLLAYHVFKGHYISTKYFTKAINSIAQGIESPLPSDIKLSEKLLSFIDQMQNDEWDGLDCSLMAISDAVCFIGTILYQLEDDEKQNALKHIEALCLTREKMETLRG